MARKRRRRKRRGSLGPYMPFLSIVLAAVAIVTALTLFFKVEHYEVTGNVRYSTEEVVAASEVPVGANLILLNKYQVAQRIYTRLPYITQVMVNTRMPNGLELSVTETQAVAAVQGGGSWWLLSSGGKLLEAVDESTAAGYVRLVGQEAVEPSLGGILVLDESCPLKPERLKSLLEELEIQECLDKTGLVDVSDPRQLVLKYDGRFDVVMYYDADFALKVECLKLAVKSLEPNERGILRMTRADNQVNFIDTSGEDAAGSTAAPEGAAAPEDTAAPMTPAGKTPVAGEE